MNEEKMVIITFPDSVNFINYHKKQSLDCRIYIRKGDL